MRQNGKASVSSRNNKADPPVDFEKAFEDGGAVDRAALKAVREAIRRHRLLGESIVVWRDGKTVVLKAGEY